MSFLNILTLIFITLKLLNKIDWSWYCVVWPSLLYATIFFVSVAWVAYLKSKEQVR